MNEQFTPNAEITDDDKLWALLSYIFSPIVSAIMLLIEDKKDRKFIRFHAVQSLALGVVAYVISFALSFIFIGCFIGFAYIIYAIYLGIKAYKGEYVTIPFVTDFCKKQGWI